MKKILLLTGDKSYYNNFNTKSEFSDTELIIFDIDKDTLEKIKGIVLSGVIVQCHINKYETNIVNGEEIVGHTKRYDIYLYCMRRVINLTK